MEKIQIIKKEINSDYSSSRHSQFTAESTLTWFKEAKCPAENPPASPQTSLQLEVVVRSTSGQLDVGRIQWEELLGNVLGKKYPHLAVGPSFLCT